MNSRDIFHLNFKIAEQILDLLEEDEILCPPILVESSFSIEYRSFWGSIYGFMESTARLKVSLKTNKPFS